MSKKTRLLRSILITSHWSLFDWSHGNKHLGECDKFFACDNNHNKNYMNKLRPHTILIILSLIHVFHIDCTTSSLLCVREEDKNYSTLLHSSAPHTIYTMCIQYIMVMMIVANLYYAVFTLSHSEHRVQEIKKESEPLEVAKIK